MVSISEIEIVLWVVVIATTIWILGPVVGFFWKGPQLGLEVYAEPMLARPYPEDADGLRRYQELLDLGYEPVGSSAEHARFLTPLHWRWRSEDLRWLASPDRRTFVHLHRLVADEPVRFVAVTVFEGGGTWHTAYPGIPGETPRVPGHGRLDLLGVSPRELLERHAAAVDDFAREQGIAVKAVSLREVVEASIAYERAALPKMGMGRLASLPLGFWGMGLIAPLWSLSMHGRARVVALGGAVFMGLVYMAIRYGMLHLARGYTARRMHTRAYELEQTAVTPDGTIVAGRYERWLRALAVLGAADLVARIAVVATKVATRKERDGGVLIFAALIVFICGTDLRRLVARARGRSATPKTKGPTDAWWNWGLAAMICSASLSGWAGALAWTGAAMALAALGWWLEKRSRA